MKRLLSVTSFTALLSILRMCTGVIIAKIIAIYAGPAGMAMLGQIQSGIGILNGIINAPLGSSIVRYTAENSSDSFDKCAPWWRASIHWVVILLLVIIPMGCLLSEELSVWLFNNDDYYWIIIIACWVLPFVAMNTLVTSVINGLQKYKIFVILGMVSNIISTTIMIILIYNYNIKGALVAAVINNAVSGLVMILAVLRQPWFKLKYWWGKTETDNRKKIASYMLMAITSTLTVPVSMIIIRNIMITNLGWEITGQWQAVWKISEVYLAVITMSLGTYYLPKLSSLKNKNAIKNEIKKTAIIVMPIVILLAMCVYFFRDVAIHFLFTKEFSEARNLFALQLCGDVMKILSWLYAYPMLSSGAARWYIGSELLFSFLLIILSWSLVPIYGAQGANLAYLINYILYFSFVFLNLSKFIK
ncbi:wzxB protein [Photobacterium leiognathi lrivu.4.1]|uniref:WzxB protein n=1 Tax=Photobacterium leiognathi lrivu.4.1 TaxID=1248232 RepID=X0NLY6_PHOLE|nr:O-antigen translocase [Photobacterium leiognathi]GAD28971.1 wzxB protein [Photobacterium leiognathi lrivu.4.1]